MKILSTRAILKFRLGLRDIDLKVEPFGGHNGFVDDWRGSTWYEAYILKALIQY